MPAVLGLLGGTALGAALAANAGWVHVAATAYFAVALAGALHLLYRRADDSKENGRMPLLIGREAGNAEQTEARKA